MSELTLVTSFFDIGRNEWQGFSHGNEQYVSYFKHWARIKNKLIIYAEPKMIDEIQSVRENYGLLDRTSIIPISDVEQIDPELYDALRTAMIQKESWRFHKRLINPESWNYHYNYIMALKIFWVKDAIARGLTDGMSAWIDFGYDHGGQDFPYSEDFDFLWQYDFSHNIHLFQKKELDSKPLFRIVQEMPVYFCGAPVIAPDDMWENFWLEIRRAALVLAECGLADDDQTLTLMAYRRHPEWFQLHKIIYWGQALHDYGGQSLRVRPPKKKTAPALHKWNHQLKDYLKEKRKELDIWHRKGRHIEKQFFK